MTWTLGLDLHGGRFLHSECSHGTHRTGTSLSEDNCGVDGTELMASILGTPAPLDPSDAEFTSELAPVILPRLGLHVS